MGLNSSKEHGTLYGNWRAPVTGAGKSSSHGKRDSNPHNNHPDTVRYGHSGNAVPPHAYMQSVEKSGQMDEDDLMSMMGAGEYPRSRLGKTGSCECDSKYIGMGDLNIDTVREYSDSLNSKAKNQIIEDILKAATSLLPGIKGDTPQERIQSMLALSPSAQQMKNDPAVHKKTCGFIASAINKAYGSKIIDEALPAEVICQHVSEILASLSAGMHSEFLVVYNDVRKVLKNLHVLKSSLKDDHDMIVAKIKASDDQQLSYQVTQLNDLHVMLTDEIDRQIQLLSNLLNISLLPAEKDLASLIKNKKDINGYIDKIDIKIGSERFGKVISDILNGMGVTANYALLIERALKIVGMTMAEYANSNSVTKLREKISDGLMSKQLNESQLHSYLNAAELLYRNFYRNQDIASKVPAQKVGGSMNRSSGSMNRVGGDMNEYDGREYQRSAIDKRVLNRGKLRNLIFGAFYKSINDHFDQFVGSLELLTQKIGGEVPMSSQLSDLRHVLQRVDETLVRNKNIYYALIGYYNDAMSKSKKDTLVGDMKMILSYVDTLMEMPLYNKSKQYFQAVHGHIKAILGLIDKFSEEIAAKFGQGDDCPDPVCEFIDESGGKSHGLSSKQSHGDEHHGVHHNAQQGLHHGSQHRDRFDNHSVQADQYQRVNPHGARASKHGSYQSMDAVFGGDADRGLAGEPKILYKSTKTVHDAIRQFDYKYRVAQIRSNMAAAGKELDHYSEKYEKIVANGIADILSEDKKVYEKLRKYISSDSSFGETKNMVSSSVQGFETEPKVTAERKAARQFLDSQWEIKQRFWATVEAADTYMRVFTDALVKNGSDIREIKSMLDEVEVINDWYSDATGNNLAGVFEYFPSYIKGDNVYYPPVSYRNDSADNATGNHYYQKIATEIRGLRTDALSKAGGKDGVDEFTIGTYTTVPLTPCTLFSTTANMIDQQNEMQELHTGNKTQSNINLAGLKKALKDMKGLEYANTALKKTALDESREVTAKYVKYADDIFLRMREERNKFDEHVGSLYDKAVGDCDVSYKKDNAADEKKFITDANESINKLLKDSQTNGNLDARNTEIGQLKTGLLTQKRRKIEIFNKELAKVPILQADGAWLQKFKDSMDETTVTSLKKYATMLGVNYDYNNAAATHIKNANTDSGSGSGSGSGKGSESESDSGSGKGTSKSSEDSTTAHSTTSSSKKFYENIYMGYENVLPGNPYLVTIPTLGEQARNKVKKTMSGLSVLKNLLSVFVHIGGKFNGNEIRKSVFMSPTQMYNNLVDYLQASAFAQGFGLNNSDNCMLDADGDLSDTFYDGSNMSISIDLRESAKQDPYPPIMTKSDYTSNNNTWNDKIKNKGTIRTDSVEKNTYIHNDIQVIANIIHVGVTSVGSPLSIQYGNMKNFKQFAGFLDKMGYTKSKSSVSSTRDGDESEGDGGKGDDEDGERERKHRDDQGQSEYHNGDGKFEGQGEFAKVTTNRSRMGYKNGGRFRGGAGDEYAKKVSSMTSTKKDNILLFKKRFGIWMRSVIPELKAMEGFGFQREDEYFVLVLKSIAAKVLTVTGLYDVFDRPMEFNGLSPIRMIIGGSSEMPKVNEEAVPLYLRLPLLVQFYRGIFGFESTEDPNNVFTDQGSDAFRRESQTLKISMVPDIDGTFSGLIRLIFRKTKFISTDAYSDDDLKELIREVNLIHQRMQSKYPQDTVMETIHELIAEVNRRYGIITKDERDNYENEMSRRFDYALRDPNSSDRYSESPETDIAILPEEGDEEIVRPSGAQKLLGATFADIPNKKRSYTISSKHKDLVYKFRCAIDRYFENPSEEFSFAQAIKAAQMKLKHETDDEKRFKIVATLVRGIDSYSKIDGFKYVFFHETVIAGLNMLSAIHSLLLKFKTRVQTIDIKALEQVVWDYFETTKGSVTGSELVKAVQAHLVKLGFDDTDVLKTHLESVFGKYEALQENGGHLDGSGSIQYALKGGNGVTIGATGASKHVDRFSKKFGVEEVNSKKTFLNNHSNTDNLLQDPSGGLSSLLVGKTVNSMKDAFNSPTKSPDKEVSETFMRFLFSREYVMKELLETIYGLSNDFQGNVEVKIDSGKILLNCGGLKTLVTEMFGNIGYFIDILRPHIKEDVFKQYVDKRTCGSYYWLYEQIMEKIILGRSAAIKPLSVDPKGRLGYTSLDELVTKLNDTWKCLTRVYNTDGTNLKDSTSGKLSTVNKITAGGVSRNNFDKVFAEMAFYDASKPSSGLIHSKETHGNVESAASTNNESRGGLKVASFLHNPYDALHFNGPIKMRLLDTRYIARFNQLYSWDTDEFTLNRSALFAFNQLIAKYIRTFYDPVSGKIYNGLINQFANGAFNRAISDQTFTYPDTSPVWFAKSTSTSESIIIRNADIIASSISGKRQADFNKAITTIRQYVNLGIKSTVSSESDRNDLFNISNSEDIGENLALHYYGKLILDGINNGMEIKGLYGASKVLASDVDKNKFKGDTAYKDITLAEAKILYLGSAGKVTIESIMHMLFNGNVNDHKARFYYLIDDETLKHKTSFISESIFDYSAAFVGTIAAKALALYPSTMKAIGNNNSDTEYSVRLFAAILVRTYDGWKSSKARSLKAKYDTVKAGTDAATKTAKKNYERAVEEFDKAYKDIRQELQSIKSTYSPGSSSPLYIIKYEDTLNAVTTNIEANSITQRDEVGYFVLGRDDVIAGVGGKTAMKDFDTTIQATDKSNIDDIVNFGRRQDPDEDHILYSSLSNIMKNIISSRSMLNQSLVYVQENVADIALYMKENMRANLPNYRNLFKALSSRCEFIKKFMNQRDISLERKYDMVGYDIKNTYTAGKTPTHNPWPHKLKPIVDDSDKTKSRFTAILDGVIRGCNSLVASCETTLREIGDDPKYFEIYQNSIKDYRSQYGVDPLMPLSSTLAILKNITHENYMDFFPVHTLGQKQFKLMYGMRSIVGQPNAQPLLEHNIGFSSIVEGYNLIIDGKMQADKDRTATYYKLFVKLLRYVFEVRHIKGLITPHIRCNLSHSDHPNKNISTTVSYHCGLYTRNDMVINKTKADYQQSIPTNRSEMSLVVITDSQNCFIDKIAKPVYAVAKSLDDVINMTESSFRDDKIKDLVEYVCGEVKSDKRLEIQNIIDLGVVPINVHALMREIPLVNLYNYAYTFDRLIIELYYGLQNENARKMISDLCNLSSPTVIMSAKDMLVALLINPYMSVGGNNCQPSAQSHDELYEQHVKDMLVGVANSGELGRPKFLSDQIYNKAVFGEVYMTPDDYNEMGPPAGQIARKRLDRNELARIYTIMVSEGLNTINKEAKFNGDLFKKNNDKSLQKIQDLSLNKFCNSLVRYILANPGTNLLDFNNLIYTNFLTTGRGVKEFILLAKNDDENSAKMLALMAGMVVKLFYYPVIWMFNKMNDDTRASLETVATECKSLFNATLLLLQDIDKDLPYLGIISTGTTIDAYIKKKGGSIGKYPPKYFKELCEEIIIYELQITMMSGNKNDKCCTIDIDNISIPYQLLYTTHINVNAPVTDKSRSKLSKLHWLDVNTDLPTTTDRERTRLQSNPYGDNNNVLDSGQVKSVSLPKNLKLILTQLGRIRFDTVLIRNLVFIVNLYRSVRMKLQRDLNYDRAITLKSIPITRTQLTEFYGNQVDHGRETKYSQTHPDMYARFNY